MTMLKRKANTQYQYITSLLRLQVLISESEKRFTQVALHLDNITARSAMEAIVKESHLHAAELNAQINELAASDAVEQEDGQQTDSKLWNKIEALLLHGTQDKILHECYNIETKIFRIYQDVLNDSEVKANESLCHRVQQQLNNIRMAFVNLKLINMDLSRYPAVGRMM